MSRWSARSTTPRRCRPRPISTWCPRRGLKLTPRHYSYLKISEGCNHRCAFCIIPSLRGDLVSRRPDAILREAEKLVAAGTKELLVISQDTSAYGVDLRHAAWPWKGGEVRAHMTDLARELGKLGAWVRLHYVYPYPHVDKVIPLMAEGLVLPYLDIPFQHASPPVLKAMKRPANEARVLERIRSWRDDLPRHRDPLDLRRRLPRRDRGGFRLSAATGSRKRSSTASAPSASSRSQGAAANALPDLVPEEVKEERYARLMELTARISAAKLQAKIGRTIDVIIDAGRRGRRRHRPLQGRRARDRRRSPSARRPARCSPATSSASQIEDADEHDLFGVPAAA